MPCENCHVQFSVFKRKRSCNDCKRFYCSSCLLKNQRSLSLCERCTIFAKRPLLRADLLSLKPKDLIFYLQSKHISTAGCVEKDELVGLVLNHIQQSDTNSPNHHNHHENNKNFNGDDTTNSFDTLKQSCQNFFSNISENISESLATFDSKTRRKSSSTANQTHMPQQSQQQSASVNASFVSEQPRVSTREIPTYASFQTHQNRTDVTRSNSRTFAESVAFNGDQTQSIVVEPNTIIADAPCTSNTALNNQRNNTQANNSNSYLNLPPSKTDCECSDDEFLANLHELLTFRNNLQQRNAATVTKNGIRDATGGGGVSASTTSTHVDICEIDENANHNNDDDDDDADSSHSSFEELGAIGGISDESKAATDTNSSNLEQWQILDNQRLENVAEDGDTVGMDKIKINEMKNKPQRTKKTLNEQFNSGVLSARKMKKVLRRRSDGYLNRRLAQSDEDSSPVSVDGGIAEINVETSGAASTSDNIKTLHCTNCKRCGKNKTSIRRHVEKMRKHLESSEMCEEDIKHELEEFLAYLESRTKSVDLSDSDGIVETSETSATNLTQSNEMTVAATEYYGENDGIHVYAASAVREAASRFINLDDFDTSEELESLTVKQLKEVLMLHRVDYKGCCEKQELLDRVERLWKNLKTAPATEKLPTDELCKICMDAPIECVILECGHMATCTNCGKVLSECPICRQYIVRVVRFFRA